MRKRHIPEFHADLLANLGILFTMQGNRMQEFHADLPLPGYREAVYNGGGGGGGNILFHPSSQGGGGGAGIRPDSVSVLVGLLIIVGIFRHRTFTQRSRHRNKQSQYK